MWSAIVKVRLPDGELKDLSEWIAEGAKQQRAFEERLIEKYFVRLKLQQTLRLIERILNDKH